MEQFDRQKFKAMIHYVIHRCRPDRLGRTKLHKVAFHADVLWYLEAGRPLTGETYVKQPRGPVAYHMTSCIDELVKSGAVQVSTVNYYGYAKYEYTALLPPPAGLFSAAEAKLLDDMTGFVCEQNTAASISELSHTEAWNAAQMGEELPYFAAMELLDGAEVDETDRVWADQEVDRLADQRTERRTVQGPLRRTLSRELR